MDAIGHVTRPSVVQSQHPGHSRHMFGDLVLLQGSRTSLDALSSGCPISSLMY